MFGIITLTTDFGAGSSYVAQMKGAILTINPQATIVDISHDVAPQDVRGANYILGDACPWYPDETIHIVVVDPGVGTRREIVHARVGTHRFIAPNNGVLTLVANRTEPKQITHITRDDYWHHPVSSTFHGRDIMAPVAAHLSLGVDATDLGPPLKELRTLDLPQPHVRAGQVHGEVIAVDTYGNVITNIGHELLSTTFAGQRIEIQALQHRVSRIAATYGDDVSGEPVALIGSSGHLEVAVPNGNAAAQLGIHIGTEILVRRGGAETDHD